MFSKKTDSAGASIKRDVELRREEITTQEISTQLEDEELQGLAGGAWYDDVWNTVKNYGPTITKTLF